MRILAAGRRLLLPLLLVASLGPPCRAQSDQDAAPEVSDVAIPTAPVELDGVVLFRLRGMSALAPETRAAAVAGRIRQVARDSRFSPDALTLGRQDGIPVLLAGELRIMMVLDADARVEGLTREDLAAASLAVVRRAIVDYRRARNPQVLLRGAGHALVATLALVAALLLLRRSWPRVEALLEAHVHGRVPRLGISSFEILRAESLWDGLRGALRVVRGLVLLVVVYAYLQFVFGLFPWTRWLSANLGDWVVGPLVAMGRGIVAQIPNLFFLTILFFVVRWVMRLLRLFFDGVERGTVQVAGFEPEWAMPTYRLVRTGVFVFAVIVAFPYIPGSSSPAFKGLSVFLGILFSLGSSSAIANVVAGYTLTYRRAFKVGDRIRIGDVIGEVTAVRVQVTHVRTPKNEEVVIPNSSILGQDVTNYSTLARSHGLLLHTTVGIGYETPWRQVEALLLAAAARTPGLLPEPAAFVLQRSLGDFCVVYEINVACDEPHAMLRRYSDLHRNILDVFNEYGVQIMTPAYEGDPEQPKVVPREQWFAAPARPPAEGDRGPQGRRG